MTAGRPTCPECGAVIDRMQRTLGVVATYPCNCWLTPAAARRVAEQWRRAQQPEALAA